ncbi:unnamed protein product [Thlaspi arvense]|uniref:Uncharacterized protein n=1 Tax=Thlaspi arvense TaxID=13288 RepID=A0AAU9RC72_THLAR|nr:unnamed protein product [Thlaspi arvense]
MAPPLTCVLLVKTGLQGVSFTIDAPFRMVYLRGNVEFGVLLKTLGKTGNHLLSMDYEVECKDPNMKPPAKRLEAPPANETDAHLLFLVNHVSFY